MKKPIAPIKPANKPTTLFINKILFQKDNISLEELLSLLKSCNKNINDIYLHSGMRDYGEYDGEAPTINFIEKITNPEYDLAIKEQEKYLYDYKKYKEDLNKYQEWLDNLALEHENE